MADIDEHSLFSKEEHRTLLGLSDEQRSTVGAIFGAVAAQPGALVDNLLDAVARARALSNDSTYRSMLDRMLMYAPKVENLPDAQASAAIRQWAQRIELFFDPKNLPLGQGTADAWPPLPACEFSWADDAEIHRRVKAFAERVPNYYAVVNSCSWGVPEHMNAYFRVSVNGPEVAYYLGQHEKTYDAIVAASPVGAVAKLLSLERELTEWRQHMTPETLYSAALPAAPTPEECEAAMRLLYLVNWAHGEVGTANAN